MKKLILLALILVCILPVVYADDNICLTYFTGVGCPHCSRTDPIILNKLVNENENIIVIEYEIYQQQENAGLLYNYDEYYNSGFGIPLLIFDKDTSIVGDRPIIKENGEILSKLKDNKCPLVDKGIDFENLDLTKLEGNPKIWAKNRVLISSNNKEVDNDFLKKLILEDDVLSILECIECKNIKTKEVPLSGSQIKFENAVKINDWIFQWNGKGLEGEGKISGDTDISGAGIAAVKDLSMGKILALAAVDAVNPCAIAVLALMLIAILTYNPKNKKNILFAGLAFSISVFIMYLIYGLVIIRFFQLIQALTSIRLILYKILGLAAIFLGILNIRDYFKYKPGGFATEMPLSMRPHLKKLISGITSPKGAFLVGAFVTVFLLPCTIGPYVIAGGILSALELIKTIPWLLIYNFIFVLPMIFITLIVYAGFAKVEDVSGWKERNIKYLHLIAGLIISALGVAMIFGWV